MACFAWPVAAAVLLRSPIEGALAAASLGAVGSNRPQRSLTAHPPHALPPQQHPRSLRGTHQSTALLCPLCVTSSGARYSGVPHSVYVLPFCIGGILPGV